MANNQRFAAGLAALIAVAVPVPALAYIGPGAGLGAIALTVGLVLGVLLLIVGLVWYPLKRLLKGSRAAADSQEKADSAE